MDDGCAILRGSMEGACKIVRGEVGRWEDGGGGCGE